MKNSCRFRPTGLFACFLGVSTAIVQPPASSAIASRSATVEGIELHHLTAGHGPAVIPPHGYPQIAHFETDHCASRGEIHRDSARSPWNRRFGHPQRWIG